MVRGRPKGSKNRPKDGTAATPAAGATTAKVKTATSGKEFGGNLTEDQRQALFLQDLNKVVGFKAKQATATADLRNAYKSAKSDGFSKKEIDFAIFLQNDDDDSATKERQQQNQIAKWLSHPMGMQTELFEDTRSVREKAFDEGKRDGAAGKKAKSDYSPASEGFQGYLEGWHQGQAAIFAIGQSKPKAVDEGGLIQTAVTKGLDDFDRVGHAAPATPDLTAPPADGDQQWPDDAAVADRKAGTATPANP